MGHIQSYGLLLKNKQNLKTIINNLNKLGLSSSSIKDFQISEIFSDLKNTKIYETGIGLFLENEIISLEVYVEGEKNDSIWLMPATKTQSGILYYNEYFMKRMLEYNDLDGIICPGDEMDFFDNDLLKLYRTKYPFMWYLPNEDV